MNNFIHIHMYPKLRCTVVWWCSRRPMITSAVRGSTISKVLSSLVKSWYPIKQARLAIAIPIISSKLHRAARYYIEKGFCRLPRFCGFKFRSVFILEKSLDPSVAMVFDILP
ncbi:hypothetical protein TWF694_008229 [Orbilia ellipsospora]|uniref:Uncharacterized protein n=1 Tax=Orbilia ellipsospora TaxID=2528407 RepID=A0AAV9XFG0_9PEZI